MVKRKLAALSALLLTALATGTAAGTAHAASPAPLPAALSNQGLVQQFDPATLVSSAWNPANNPGNCPATQNGAFANSAGYAEIDTNGAANDCRSIQSPHASLPTAPGTTYEALMNFSSFHDWPALWMYGPNWPNQGEIDAVEGGPGSSAVTWHQAGNYTIGPDPWDNQQVPFAGGPDIQPGTWTTVDISFTASGVDVYYNGTLYVHIPESVTTSGNDPMFLTISEGSCNAEGVNVCNGGTSPAGSVQTQWVREFSTSAGGGGTGGTGTCAIRNDASSPARVQLANTTAATATTAAFSPPAGSDVVVQAGVGFDTGQSTGPAVTVKDSQGTVFTAGPSAWDGHGEGSYVFSHYYATAPGAVTVTATRAGASQAAMFSVNTRVLTGAAASQAGAAALTASGSGTTAETRSFTPTVVQSDTEVMTTEANTPALTASGLATDSSWFSGNDGEATASGHVKAASLSPVTVGWNAASATNWALAGLEVRPALTC